MEGGSQKQDQSIQESHRVISPREGKHRQDKRCRNRQLEGEMHSDIERPSKGVSRLPGINKRDAECEQPPSGRVNLQGKR